MKVAGLREKISKLDKEEIARLAVEFYKLIPKSKKEDYNIDELISNPKKIKEELEKARAHGVELRDNLIKLLQIIENEDRLPEYIPN